MHIYNQITGMLKYINRYKDPLFALFNCLFVFLTFMFF